MKIVINGCYGGFRVCDWACKELGIKGYEESRTNESLIDMIERFGSECISGEYSILEVVEIPDEATDWMINEYDGNETVIYVLDGKLHTI